MRWPLLLALVLAPACKDSKPGSGADNSAESPATAPIDPVLLFVSADEAGRPRLFSLSPTGGEPQSVAAADDLEVMTALVSWSGTALAVLGGGDPGPARVHRGHLGDELSLEPVGPVHASAHPRAISDDGQTIVVSVPSGLLVLRDGTQRRLDFDDSLRYGVALSGDGSKLAYSTMKRDCAGGIQQAAQCPVTLLGVDLSADAEPRELAGDDGSVAYDPQFRDVAGSELLYMTNRGDASDACKRHVNDCTYDVRSIAWSGDNDRVVVEGGVHGRQAKDGTIAHRTLAGGWGKQRLVIGGRAIEGHVGHRLHHWSPNSRWLALTRIGDKGASLEVIDTKGGAVRDGLSGRDHRIAGWSVRGVAAGKHSVAEPRERRKLRRAVKLARARTGRDGKLALMAVSSRAKDELRLDVPVLKTSAEAASWLKDNDGIIISPLFDYCRIRQRNPSVRPLVAIDSEFVLLGQSRLAPRVTERPPLRGRFQIPDGSTLTLAGIELPESAAVSSSFTLGLRWLADAPVARGWKVLVHFDGRGRRFQADHTPPVCAQDGKLFEYEIDVNVAHSRSPVLPGSYDVYVGWFKGATRAGDRVKVGAIEITP